MLIGLNHLFEQQLYAVKKSSLAYSIRYTFARRAGKVGYLSFKTRTAVVSSSVVVPFGN